MPAYYFPMIFFSIISITVICITFYSMLMSRVNHLEKYYDEEIRQLKKEVGDNSIILHSELFRLEFERMKEKI